MIRHKIEMVEHASVDEQWESIKNQFRAFLFHQLISDISLMEYMSHEIDISNIKK